MMSEANVADGNAGMIDEEVGVEQAGDTAKVYEGDAESGSSKRSVTVAGMTIDETQLPLFIVLIASVVLLVATGAEYEWDFKDSYAGYAVSISCVSFGLSFLTIIMTQFTEELHSKVGTPMNMLCFLYSLIGACFLTFNEPFDTTGNGYFSAWAVVFGSAMSLGMTASALGSTIKGLGPLMGLSAASVIVIIATAAPIKDNFYRDEATYAIVLAGVTWVFVLLATAYEKKNGSMPRMAYFGALATLAACWWIMAFIVTFRGPFKTTGNGYFASWAGSLLVSMAAFAAKHGA